MAATFGLPFAAATTSPMKRAQILLMQRTVPQSRQTKVVPWITITGGSAERSGEPRIRSVNSRTDYGFDKHL